MERLTQAPAPAGWWQRLREAVADRFMAGLPGPEGTVAATLFTGLGSADPRADRAAFRDSGLAHLLAVAGLHIGIVMGLVMGATRFGLALSERAALRWPCKQIAAAAALAAGGGYVLLTGMHVPVLRSFAMAALVTLGVAVGRRAISHARAGAGGDGADAGCAAGGARRLVPDELRRRAGADRRATRRCARCCPASAAAGCCTMPRRWC